MNILLMRGARRLFIVLFIGALAGAAGPFAAKPPSPEADTYVRVGGVAPDRLIGHTPTVSAFFFTIDGTASQAICCAGESTDKDERATSEQSGNRPLGTLIGVLFGGEPEDRIGESDRRCAWQALELADDKQRMVWRNRDESAAHWFTPLKTFRSGGGLVCRDFEVALMRREAGPDVAIRTACRQPSGNWLIRN